MTFWILYLIGVGAVCRHYHSARIPMSWRAWASVLLWPIFQVAFGVLEFLSGEDELLLPWLESRR